MKCYAVITRFEGEKSTLHIPSNWTALSFMANQIKKYAPDLDKACEALPPEKYYYDTLGEMKIYGAKLGENYWAVACDSELSSEQQRHLTINLLFHKIAPKDVAHNLLQYTDKAQDPKIAQIQQELHETKQVLVEALDKLETRGEKISDLLTKTEELKQSTFAFRKEAENLNRCWPFCTLI